MITRNYQIVIFSITKIHIVMIIQIDKKVLCIM